MSRVAVGDFDSLFRRGLEDILAAGDVEIVRSGTVEMADYLRSALPDVILLDSTKASTPSLVDRIVRDYPTVQVITCSALEETMHVYPPYHHGESYACPLSPAEIGRQVQP